MNINTSKEYTFNTSHALEITLWSLKHQDENEVQREVIEGQFVLALSLCDVYFTIQNQCMPIFELQHHLWWLHLNVHFFAYKYLRKGGKKTVSLHVQQ